jgi:hypothetical protein
LIWAILPSVLAAFFTLLLVNIGFLRSFALLLFSLIALLTFIYPFHAYIILNIFKPIIDAFYDFQIGPIKITQMVSVYAVLVWFSYMFVKRRITQPLTPFDYINFLFLLLLPAPLLFAPGIPTLESTFRLLSGWGFYWLARETGKGEERAIEIAFILSGIFPTVTGFLSLMGFIPNAFHEEELRRLRAVYYDATAFGFELVPMWSFLLYRLNKRLSIIELILFLLSSYLLYKTYTRALWTSAFLTILLTALMGGKFSRFALLFTVIYALYNLDEITLRFSERGLGTDPESFNGRVQIWLLGLQRFLSLNPLEMFFGVSIIGKPMGIFLHNLFLVFLFDYGILGALMFSVWTLMVIFLIFRSKSEKRWVFISSAVFSFVGGLTTGSFLYPNFQWFVMSSFGLLVKDEIKGFVPEDLQIAGASEPKEPKSRNPKDKTQNKLV